MKTNIPKKFTEKTHEGATASWIDAYSQLRRSVMTCMLLENTFYEDGVSIADRIKSLVSVVDSDSVARLAIEARHSMNLRHVPLLLVRELARKGYPVADLLFDIICRPDELAEFLSIYWKDGRCPLSAQVKKGLAKAFTKFNEYQLAKYDRRGAIKLKDVLFLCHAKPLNDEQGEVWKRLVNGTLAIPVTWETELSAGKYKKATWEMLLSERKLGGLAFLRNLRNMVECNVDDDLILAYFDICNFDWVLPFRFIAAARWVPRFESRIEKAMFKSVADMKRLPGKTVLLVDVSGSMTDQISKKSELKRSDAAIGLSILARELCENVRVFTFSHYTVEVPDRRGFSLRDAIINSQSHSSTYLGEAVEHINKTVDYDRFIVITDEQTADKVENPKGIGYMINVATYENGVGYGKWIHIDGWSEAVFNFIIESESNNE